MADRQHDMRAAMNSLAIFQDDRPRICLRPALSDSRNLLDPAAEPDLAAERFRFRARMFSTIGHET
jgi:hypothetical protein